MMDVFAGGNPNFNEQTGQMYGRLSRPDNFAPMPMPKPEMPPGLFYGGGDMGGLGAGQPGAMGGMMGAGSMGGMQRPSPFGGGMRRGNPMAAALRSYGAQMGQGATPMSNMLPDNKVPSGGAPSQGMGMLGTRSPYAGQGMSGPDQQAMTQAWATGNFNPGNPLWNHIDPSYSPQTAQGFTPQIAGAVNGAEPNAGVMRGRDYQLMANLGRPERVAYLQANPDYARSQGITPEMIAAAGHGIG